MMIRPRFFKGAKSAERGPIMIWGWSEVKMDSQARWRSASVCLEWRRVI